MERLLPLLKRQLHRNFNPVGQRIAAEYYERLLYCIARGYLETGNLRRARRYITLLVRQGGWLSDLRVRLGGGFVLESFRWMKNFTFGTFLPWCSWGKSDIIQLKQSKIGGQPLERRKIMLQSLLSSEVIFSALDEAQTEKLMEVLGDKYEEKKGKCDNFRTAMTFYEALSERVGYIDGKLIPESLQGDVINATVSAGFVKTSIFPGNYSGTGTLCYVGKYLLYGLDKDDAAECYEYISGDLSKQEQDACNAQIESTHPKWIRLSTATNKYNCHSYCWIDNSYDNIYWLPDPQVYASSSAFTNRGANTSIAGHDSYIIIYDEERPAHSVRSKTGSDGTSMVSYMTTTTVISKLGSYGVYQTTLYDMYNLYDGRYYISYNKK